VTTSTITVAAPGRVNVIGEHTDYNRGFALPLALPHRVTVHADRHPLPDRQEVVASSVGHGTITVPLDTQPGDIDGWGSYLAGVMWALKQNGYDVPPAHLELESNVPTGAGLSSSAALECAVLVAFAELADWNIDPTEAALIAQQAENQYVGAPTGSMDQMASMHGRQGHMMFMDFADNSVRQVPADLAAAGMELLVIDTRAPHRHVAGEYGARRRSCEIAQEILGVPSLRDISSNDLPHALATLQASTPPDGQHPDTLARRVKHVVSENERVRRAVHNLENGELENLGPILTEGHASLRDDYEVTVAQLDVAAAAAEEAGALGARMTGGGFGGSVIALVYQDQAGVIEDAVKAAFAEAEYTTPEIFHATPSRGAGRIDI